MLGLILIFFIGRAFYELATAFERNQWGHTILGIASYYAGTLIGGFIIGVIITLYYPEALEEIENGNDMLYSFMSVPFGLLVCWLVYRYLKSIWSRLSLISDSLDSEFMQ
jgi:hypothetical protein